MSDRDQYLKTPEENMNEFAAITKMWIAFHEARPEVSLTWFIRHYKDGELVAEWVNDEDDAAAPPVGTQEKEN
jgi:hypothetical protein